MLTLAGGDFAAPVDLKHQPLPVMPDELQGSCSRELMGYDLKMRVWRGDSSGGDLGDYTVEVEEGEVVLDAIHRLQATQAGDLAVRWNCKAGKCGSCSAEINGRPRLMCMTRLSDFEPRRDDHGHADARVPGDPRPGHRRVVQLREGQAGAGARKLTPRDADGKRRMMQADVERGQEFRKCIECFLCQNVCHVVRDHEENKPAFAGPRFFLRYAELDMHPLDTNDRRKLAQDAAGLGMCNITKCCTEVCPEGIHITDNAIIPMKERVVDRKYDPVDLARHRRSAAATPARRGVAEMATLPQDEIDGALAGDLSAWSQDGDAITREVQAPSSFLAGIGLVQRVAEAAEEIDHHPDVDIRYTTLTFTLSTHSEGGLTAKDLELAGRIDALAADTRACRDRPSRWLRRELASSTCAEERACERLEVNLRTSARR